MLEIAVIGGGPIGSRVAYKLAEFGYRVIVFEKRSSIGEKLCCTGIISQECILNFNISSEVVFRKINSARIFSPSGEFVRIHRAEDQACVIDRSAFDRILARQAQERGVEYLLSSEVTSIYVQRDKVRIDVDLRGSPRHFEACAAILTTGFNAPLVRKLGLGVTTDFVAGAQAQVETHEIEEIEIYFDQRLAPGFFAWLVPTAEGRCLAGLMSRNSSGKGLRYWLEKLEDRGRIRLDGNNVLYGGIPLKPLRKTFADRILVVGDAAGQVKPTTGGGIYFGMLCADIASETLHNAIEKGDVSAVQLSRYERSWRKKIGTELKGEYIARRLYEHLSDHQINALISRARSAGIIDSLLKEDVSFDWHGGLLLKILKAGLMSQASRTLRNLSGKDK